jgi:hypothetical protein
MQLFMAVPMAPLAACPTWAARDIANFLLSLAAPHLHAVLVLVTGSKFIASINDTGDH